MRVIVRMLVRVNRPISVSMFMSMRVNMCVFVLMVMDLRVARLSVFFTKAMHIPAFDHNVNLGSGEAAAGDLLHFETRAHVQRHSSFFKHREGHAGLDESAEQHVSTDAGKTVQIGNSHRENCKSPT